MGNGGRREVENVCSHHPVRGRKEGGRHLPSRLGTACKQRAQRVRQGREAGREVPSHPVKGEGAPNVPLSAAFFL